MERKDGPYIRIIWSMKRVSIIDMKAQLSSVVAAAERGETILITRHGRAVARLEPADPPYVHRGRFVGRRWPAPVTTGIGARALEALLEDRRDR
jgi:prevent-host-death family protein